MKPTQSTSPALLTPAGILNSIRNADRLAMIGLVAANIFPIALAIVFGWEISDVVFFYWWENVVVGLFAILRIAFAQGGGALMQMNGSKLFVIPFFTAHYFFFCFIHITFLRIFFKGDNQSIESPFEFLSNLAGNLNELLPVAGWIGILGLIASHGFSFVRNYIMGGEYKKAISFIEMFRPYGRIVVLHIGIIAGGFAVVLLGSPMIMVVLLMLLKTALDLASHASMHFLAGSMDDVLERIGKHKESVGDHSQRD